MYCLIGRQRTLGHVFRLIVTRTTTQGAHGRRSCIRQRRQVVCASSLIAELASTMSLLQVDDALRHWMLHHNVSLDVLFQSEAWPSHVACIADLLFTADILSQPTATPDSTKPRMTQLRWRQADDICQAMPWIVRVIEDSVPDVTTFVDCEFTKSMPVNVPHCCSDSRYMDRTSLRGIATLLVLLPVEPPSHYDGYLHPDFTESTMARLFTTDASDEAASDADVTAHRQVQLSSDGALSSEYEGVSDVTDDFGISIGVGVHDELVQTSDPSDHASYADVPGHPPPGLEATSVGTVCSSASHCNTYSALCCRPLSPNSAPSAPYPSLAHGEFYDEAPAHILQYHLLPTPFYPVPLGPLLCVADGQNIIPLMCAALHQRRALGLCNSPVVGILLPHAEEGAARCEVMFGWMEGEQRTSRVLLPRTHIVASSVKSHCGLPRTVYDLRCLQSRLRLARSLATLGPHIARSLSDRSPPCHRPSCVPSLAEPFSMGWRADTPLA
ncbi:hypothetical protein C8Q80DRAFT_184209 [Daedaleopsis nitida]|nr:hypothetical protein C8Q80DRAFT_184209 [Daedaleopsis nitida]